MLVISSVLLIKTVNKKLVNKIYYTKYSKIVSNVTDKHIIWNVKYVKYVKL
jgi:hypothetical protein